ncbi:heparan-alpha-glucosaminide N-acetyltransferase domain-containing protein [Kineococcus rubinsiae]|uniref:heparan-alpha-glucosaminide N-acetyltransferase domain-containing protein n=1 Tax=Kineococcus rubinsiae TaxID=2609562 RepID=UPI001432065F|nr:heparan-alpha-glucosaminide N-acetyltransferase domain-containing protein [Kineococcus rubinsiae]NIZ91883.1 DUF1624 domain-containing protein [Kineococcus rubinsiae]
MQAPPQTPPRTRPDRVVGVDLTRGLAIAGMMAAHIVSARDTGVPLTLYELSEGRASAAFAVLAGVSLGLAHRRADERRARVAARVSILVRGLLIGLVGMLLVDLGTNIAVILPYYGLAFLAVLPVLWWPARRLLPLAAGWLLLAPFAAFALRRHLPPGPGDQPTLASLLHPLDLLPTLLVTGYYPVIGWTGYLLLGLAVSRRDLRDALTGVRLLAGGAALAAAAWIASALLLGPLGGRAAVGVLRGAVFYGTVPTQTWWWLAVRSPHSGTPPDLLHTSGCALAVLGLTLLLPHVVALALSPLAAFGGMPLTVYTAHVVAIALVPADGSTRPGVLLAAHVLAGCVLASAWRTFVGRGPLESVVRTLSLGAALAVAGPAPADRAPADTAPGDGAPGDPAARDVAPPG